MNSYIGDIFSLYDDVNMSVAQKFEDGYIILERFLYGVTESHLGLVNLKKNIGPEMVYGKSPIVSIEFPGEYDIDGVQLKVRVTKDDRLHYVILMNGKKYALVNNTAVLKEMDTNNVDVWLFEEAKMQDALEKLEYEGDMELMGAE